MSLVFVTAMSIKLQAMEVEGILSDQSHISLNYPQRNVDLQRTRRATRALLGSGLAAVAWIVSIVLLLFFGEIFPKAIVIAYGFAWILLVICPSYAIKVLWREVRSAEAGLSGAVKIMLKCAILVMSLCTISGIYLAAYGLGTFFTELGHSRNIAMRHQIEFDGVAIASACREFCESRGRYPQSLSELSDNYTELRGHVQSEPAGDKQSELGRDNLQSYFDMCSGAIPAWSYRDSNILLLVSKDVPPDGSRLFVFTSGRYLWVPEGEFAKEIARANAYRLQITKQAIETR